MCVIESDCEWRVEVDIIFTHTYILLQISENSLEVGALHITQDGGRGRSKRQVSCILYLFNIKSI